MASGPPRSAAEADARARASTLQHILGDYVEELTFQTPVGLSLTRGLRPRHVPAELRNDSVVRGLVFGLLALQQRIANLRRQPPPSPSQMLEP